MIRIGLVGGRGYVGAELLRLLDRHPEFEVAWVGSSSRAGNPVFETDRDQSQTDLCFQPLETVTMKAVQVDAWVLAQANGQAAMWVAALENESVKFLDVSSDYRFDPDWVYGLPEKNRSLLRAADRVSNPGCYATATQLGLLPILDQIAAPPIAFGVSGFSGAGKTPSDRNNPRRLADNLLPYALVGHGHEQEVIFHLGRPIHLVPHVAQFFRGISMTINIPLKKSFDPSKTMERYEKYYESESMVDISAEIPEIAAVRDTPLAIIGGFAADETGHRVVVVSVIDNLLKGAASQAIQNLELMFENESATIKTQQAAETVDPQKNMPHC